MIGPQPPPPPPPPRPHQQQQEGEPSSEERQRRQYQGQPTSEEEGMGRPGGDDTARQAQQQRIEPAILQLWAEVGERLNRNQTGECSFFGGQYGHWSCCAIVHAPPPG